MRESKLCKWLIRLDKGEQNAFLRYLEALGGKNREELHAIAKHFIKKVVRGSKSLSREDFYIDMGWPAPYNPGHLHSRLTDLKKKLEAFLAIQELRKNPVAVAAYHLRGVEQRGWTDLVKSEIKQARETLAEAPQEADCYLYAMQIEENYLNAVMESPRKFKEPSFQGAMLRLEEFFCLQKLRYACAAVSQDRALNMQHDYGMLDSVLSTVGERLRDSPVILRMYFHAYMMLTAPGEDLHFMTLKQELAEHWKELSSELVHEFYKHLINFCVVRINAGFPEYNEEIGQIYNETMGSGALLVDGKLDPGQLKNMVAIMIRLKKLEVAEQLLETYGPRLTPDADIVTVDFNRALILYHQGKYAQTRKLMELVQRDAQDVFFKLEAKLYSMRASYELNDLDLSEDNYNALRMYLKRDKLLPRISRDNYLLFINLLNRLWSILQDPSAPKKKRQKLEDLRSKVDDAPKTANFVWLKEKIELEIAKLP